MIKSISVSDLFVVSYTLCSYSYNDIKFFIILSLSSITHVGTVSIHIENSIS